MEPSTTTNTLDTIIKGKWQWQSNPDPWLKTEPPEWESYSLDQNYLIEKAYYEQKEEVDIGDYLVYPLDLLQRKKGNPEAQRPIRRVDWMDNEETHIRSERYHKTELPKTINRIFGGLGDFIRFFSRRNEKILEFTSNFKELEKSNNLEILNHEICPRLVECLEEVLLKPNGEQLKDPSIKKFKKKILTEAKGRIEELISAFQQPFTGFEEFYRQILRAYTMNTDLYPDLNKYLRNESWMEVDKLLPYAFCLCKAFFHLKLMPSFMKKEVEEEKKSPLEELTSKILYRGTAFNELDLSFYDMTKIQYFSWNSVTSTTTNKKVAEEFMYNSVDIKEKKDPVMFIIEVPHVMESEDYLKWLDIGKYSAMPKEEEVVLAPGSVFELVEVLTDQHKKTTTIRIKLKNEVQSLAHRGMMMQGTLQSQMMTEKEARIMCLEREELHQALMSISGNQLLEGVEFYLCTFDKKLLRKMFEILPTLERGKRLKFFACNFKENGEITVEKPLEEKKVEITKLEVIEENAFFQMIFNENLNQNYWVALRELDIDFRSRLSITDEELNCLVSQRLKYIPLVTSLNINFKGCIYLTDEGVKIFAQSLDSLTQLTYFNLNFKWCNKITNEAVDSLAGSLNSLTKLKHLSLNFRYCEQITSEAAKSLVKALSSLTQLTQLKINSKDCKLISGQGVDALAAQGLKSLLQLKSLHLGFDCTENTNWLIQELGNLTQLSSLTLGYLYYDDEELMSFVSNGLKNLTQLTYLTLHFRQKGSQNITDKGLEVLASQGLKSLTSLKSLRLRFAIYNQITNQGVHSLAYEGLKHLTQLESLALRFDACGNITDEGVSSLMSQGLKDLTQLASLTLGFSSCSQITDKGMETLASQWLSNLPIFGSLTVQNQTLQDKNSQHQQESSSRVKLAREISQKYKQAFEKEPATLLSENVDFKVASNLSEPFQQSDHIISQDFLGKLVPILEDRSHDLHPTQQIFSEIHHLTSLNLDFRTYKNIITDEFLHSLASQVLGHCPQLRSLTLDFSDCDQITDTGVGDLALYGLKSLTVLTSLTLYFNSFFSSKITDKGITDLASEGLGHLSQLKSFHLRFTGYSGITDKGIVGFASEGLRHLSQLKSLKLIFSGRNKTTGKGWIDFASNGLKHLSQLESLVLRPYDKLTDEGAQGLVSQGIQYLHQLKSLALNLSPSQITDNGISDQAWEGLKHLSQLKSLDLSFPGCITAKGLINLASNGIRHLSQLDSLALNLRSSYAKDLDEGISDLVSEGLKCLTQLKSLTIDFSISHLTAKGVNNLILQIVKNLPQLINLDLAFEQARNISGSTVQNIIKILHYFGFTKEIVSLQTQ